MNSKHYKYICLYTNTIINIMDTFLNTKNELFVRSMEDINRTIKRYNKFSPEQRSLMLTDKMVLLFTVFKIAMINSNDYELDKITKNEELSEEQKLETKKEYLSKMDKIAETLDLIKEEFYKLEDFIQSESKSDLKNIVEKLDAVLLGPDYSDGKEMMLNAQENFNTNKCYEKI